MDGAIPTHTIPGIPWRSYCYNGHPPQFLPIVPFNLSPMQAKDPKPGTSQPSTSSNRLFGLPHILELLSNTHVQVLAHTPELLTLKLLSISSLSYNQLLNVVADKVAALSAATSSAEHHQRSGQQLQALTILLERTHTTLTGHCSTLKQTPGRVGGNWRNHGVSPLNVEHEISTLRSDAFEDLEHLMRRCLQIQAEVRATGEALVQAGQLLQTQRSEEQTHEINSLTRVAFFFLPLSFVASIFGMNVAQFADNPHIWIFFATAVPCTMATFVVAKWDTIKGAIRRTPHVS
jgi:Mg2+ and Co2+ transporter CorA